MEPDELVLEIVCGNGQFARRMAHLGARVIASYISERMIEHVKARTTKNAGRIEYSVLDATDEEALTTLSENRFDAAVCTMAIMDMSMIEPLLSSLSRLLKTMGDLSFR